MDGKEFFFIQIIAVVVYVCVMIIFAVKNAKTFFPCVKEEWQMERTVFAIIFGIMFLALTVLWPVNLFISQQKEMEG